MQSDVSSSFALRICALLTAGLLVACDGNPAPGTVVSVGTGGTVITVTEGPLAGTILAIPAGALPTGLDVAIGPSTPQDLPGLDRVGPGTNFSPTGAELDPMGKATLVFEGDLVPMGAVAGDFVVVRRTNKGRLVELTPTKVDLVKSTVEIDVVQFAAYWVTLKTSSTDLFLPPFFPMFDGDRYLFDNGVGLTITVSTTEPNLGGIPVTRATFLARSRELGLYLDRILGETFLVGSFSKTAGFQELGPPGLLWLPESGGLESKTADEGRFAGFVPFGAQFVDFFSEVRISTTLVSLGRLDTPLGRFENVLEVLFITESRVDDVLTETEDRIWFAPGVGPIQIELDGVAGRGTIVEGRGGGAIIFPR